MTDFYQQIGKVKIHRRTYIALGSLTLEEKDNFWKLVDYLQTFSPNQPAEEPWKIRLYNPKDNYYVARVDKSLRIIFGFSAEKEIEVLDIFPQERIELMFGKTSSLSEANLK